MNTIFRFYKTFYSVVIIIVFIMNNCLLFSKNHSVIIPQKVGEIVNSYTNGNCNPLFIIEDLHCNKECQLKIKNTLELLRNNYGKINLIGVEGSYSEIDMSVLKNVKKKKRDKVIELMLDKGQITGEEIYGAENDVSIIGLEDKEIYFDNLKMLYLGMSAKEVITFKIDSVTKKIRNIKNVLLKLVNKDSDKFLNCVKKDLSKKPELVKLKKFEEIKKSYGDGKVNLEEYIRKLVRIGGINIISKTHNSLASTSIKKFFKLLELKTKIDHSKVEVEFNYIIKDVKNLISDKEYSLLTNAANKFQVLSTILNKNKIKYEHKYKHLALYLKFLKAQTNLDKALLIKEVKKIELHIKNNFLKSDDLKNLIFLEDYLETLKKYLTNNAIKTEKEYIQQKRTRYNKIIKDLGKRIDLIDVFSDKDIKETYSNMQKFYELAAMRDEILIKNMLSISQFKDKCNVMIIGGYHTQGITQILRNKGVSFTVIRPNITKKSNKKIYIQRLIETGQALENKKRDEKKGKPSFPKVKLYTLKH